MSEDESSETRFAGYERFKKYAQKIGLHIEDPGERVEAIKRLSFKQFLQILSTSNALVRNLKIGHKDRAPGDVMMGGSFEVLSSLPNPKENLKIFFEEKLKKEISVENIEEWAIKLYFAIEYSHCFGNGNGRLARESYCILTGKQNSQPKERSGRLLDLSTRLFYVTMLYLYNEELNLGFTKLPELEEYFESECQNYEIFHQSHPNYIKLIVAKKYSDKNKDQIFDELLIKFFHMLFGEPFDRIKTTLLKGFAEEFE